MSWLSKLVSYFSGEEEKEYEKNKVLAQEDQNVRNVLSNTDASIEEEYRSNYKAEAKVSFQYPKGNFRFPIIPDEKRSNRDERPKRKSRPYEVPKQKENVAPVLKRPTKPKITKKPVEVAKSKRAFHPTDIPSPVYGYQTSAERKQSRKPKVDNHDGISIMPSQKLEDDIAEDLILKQREEVKSKHSISNQTNTKIANSSLSFSIENHNEDISIFDNEDKEIILEEVDQTNQSISFPPNYDKAHNPVEEIFLNNDEIAATEEEVVGRESVLGDDQFKDFDIIQSPSLESEVSETPNSDVDPVKIISTSEHERMNENRINLGEASAQESEHIFNQKLDEQSQDIFYELDEEIPPIKEDEVFEKDVEAEFHSSINTEELSQSFPTRHEEHSIDDEQPHAHESKLGLSDKEKQPNKTRTETNKGLPFNVMMLGRDKHRMKKTENSYQFPSVAYLNVPEREVIEDHSWLDEQKELLDLTLKNFNVRASVVNVTQGPAVTRFEVHPEPGVKVNKITNLSDDIKLSLSAKDIRIEAPIPGKNTIGIEVPNKVSKMVYLREILRSPEFRSNPSPLTAVLGLDISGQPAVTDLKKMPHGLIAGATGSGKSVCINTILVSLLYKASPHEVKLMLIDPKMVELAPYNEIPHLVSPVITDVKAATAALKWAVEEMERRYELFAHSGTREITRYNQLVKEHNQGEHLPFLVIIIDELADLMMVAPNDVEEAICRIAQKARACGIHLIVATQRPSVDVITGLIKANIPTRIAFSVSSQVDSRTIIDVAGAEKLLGKGDMLFLENGSSKAVRLQGTFVSDEEIERVVKHVRLQSKPDYLFHQDELVKKATIQSEEDELFSEVCEFVVSQGGASTSLLQRRFRIGYNRAARLIDMMELQGIISENRGSKPRDILISEEELDIIQGQ